MQSLDNDDAALLAALCVPLLPVRQKNTSETNAHLVGVGVKVNVRLYQVDVVDLVLSPGRARVSDVVHLRFSSRTTVEWREMPEERRFGGQKGGNVWGGGRSYRNTLIAALDKSLTYLRLHQTYKTVVPTSSRSFFTLLATLPFRFCDCWCRSPGVHIELSKDDMSNTVEGDRCENSGVYNSFAIIKY